jgi:SAM-dependent methyltransferase
MLFQKISNKIYYRILPNLRYLHQSSFRMCHCCQKYSLILSFSEGEESKICLRCRANLRYEMLAEYLQKECTPLQEKTILELDPNSPLKPILSKAKKYIQTFYAENILPGASREDGVRCEDITRLTFPDNSFDLMVSSDVLEHVPDINAAFREMHRVLRPGGFHLFTVPPRSKTRKRAEIIDGQIRFLMEPEYHSDPLDPRGILAFWDFGVDAIEMFAQSGLCINIVSGPQGKDARIVWKAEKMTTSSKIS